MNEVLYENGSPVMGDVLLNEIIYAADEGMDYTYLEDTRINIVSKKTVGKDRTIVVSIGGVQ